MEQLEINTGLQISKKANEVYEAIVDPNKMSNYFIAESTGNLVEGTSVTWKFPEFEGDVLIEVTKVIPNELISFVWEGAKGKKLKVKISLTEMPDSSTVVKVTEGKLPADAAGITWYGGNTEGWANFLACLKAYLEYDINLRKGAFEFRRGEM
ncbi:ATPase [Antarcticibacterium flavum]|uniref:ATPase n=1 Tax=Antarcticibacterium flavum TaxID=2058175 RepID=A0A5B7X6C0_9FLAO|nr:MULTISPECIES: SRPBCC domain-containing protein [Antarcticibacterium]MCM4158403.1 ATPase [Antarcticibacterium sp. W02-3]QCY70163.1 ATPase [Antarcticibacterium flavum]